MGCNRAMRGNGSKDIPPRGEGDNELHRDNRENKRHGYSPADKERKPASLQDVRTENGGILEPTIIIVPETNNHKTYECICNTEYRFRAVGYNHRFVERIIKENLPTLLILEPEDVKCTCFKL